MCYMDELKEKSALLLKSVEPIISQIALLHLRKENILRGSTPTTSINEELYRLASYYQSLLSDVLGLSVEDMMVVPKRIIDLLIREIDGAWWSESMLFDLSAEEGSEVGAFMAEYNKDGHLTFRSY